MFDIIVVEGDLEVAIVSALFTACGLPVERERIVNKRGIERFWADAPRLNRAARHQHVFGLADLERAECAPVLLSDKLKGTRAPGFVLRLAVRMSEAWLLADRSGIASFLGVVASAVPTDPEALPNPKQALINLARRSRTRRIRDGLVPPAGTIRAVGLEYTALLSEFILNRWDPIVASSHSDSLRRALARLQESPVR